VPETGEYRGYEGLQEFTSNQAEAFEEMSVQPAEFIDVGDQVVVPVRSAGTARHSGIETTFSVVHVWTQSVTVRSLGSTCTGVPRMPSKPRAWRSEAVSENLDLVRSIARTGNLLPAETGSPRS
jgi:hypothetical protein